MPVLRQEAEQYFLPKRLRGEAVTGKNRTVIHADCSDSVKRFLAKIYNRVDKTVFSWPLALASAQALADERENDLVLSCRALVVCCMLA